ncbi:MAG: hypothetical protein ABI325_10375 [Ginsengibacter sp.]
MDTLRRNLPLVHPGEILQSELIESNKQAVTEVATMLKVSRRSLSNIINQKLV